MECGVVSRRFAWFGVVSGGLAWFGFGCGVRGWAVAPSSSVCVVGGLHLCVWGGGSFLSSPPVELPSLPSCRRWCLLLLRRVVETTTWNSIVPEQFRVDFVFWSFPCVHLMSFVCILSLSLKTVFSSYVSFFVVVLPTCGAGAAPSLPPSFGVLVLFFGGVFLSFIGRAIAFSLVGGGAFSLASCWWCCLF